MGQLRSRVFGLLVYASCLTFGANSHSEAAVVHPALNPIGFDHWTATAGFTGSWSSTNANLDVGAQTSAHVESVLESPAWLNTSLTFVGGGHCGSGGAACSVDKKTGSFSGTANVFAIHYENNFIALQYPDPISNFSFHVDNFVIALLHLFGLSDVKIGFLPPRISDIYAFNYSVSPVPLPAALPLMATGLAAMYLVVRRRRRTARASASA